MCVQLKDFRIWLSLSLSQLVRNSSNCKVNVQKSKTRELSDGKIKISEWTDTSAFLLRLVLFFGQLSNRVPLRRSRLCVAASQYPSKRRATRVCAVLGCMRIANNKATPAAAAGFKLLAKFIIDMGPLPIPVLNLPLQIPMQQISIHVCCWLPIAF